MTTQTIVVTGATGAQGSAVVDGLLARGHTVRGVTRKIESTSSQALQKRGVEMVKGDLTDAESMTAAMKGADAVFSLGTPYEGGVSIETKQGVTVADAAHRAGAYIVYSSVGNADTRTGIPHFESKYEVEKHLKAIGARHSVVAPAAFMENLKAFKSQLQEGVYPSPLSHDRKLGQIAVKDIAAVAVALLESPERYQGRRFDILGDEVSPDDTVRILSQVIGRPFKHFKLPLEAIKARMGDDGVKMFEWFERTGYSVNREKLRQDFPLVAFTTFEDWAKAFDWQAFLAK